MGNPTNTQRIESLENQLHNLPIQINSELDKFRFEITQNNIAIHSQIETLNQNNLTLSSQMENLKRTLQLLGDKLTAQSNPPFQIVQNHPINNPENGGSPQPIPINPENSNPKTKKIDLPMFDGVNPDAWI